MINFNIYIYGEPYHSSFGSLLINMKYECEYVLTSTPLQWSTNTENISFDVPIINALAIF